MKATRTCLILGAYGLLGCTLAPHLTQQGWNVMRQGRAQESAIRCSLSNVEELTSILVSGDVDCVVNLVAATNVDQCETDPGIACTTNVATTQVVADALNSSSLHRRPHLVHISTDQVYSGPGPHAEDRVTPSNVYGLSKLAGELVAARAAATVLRTNFIGRSKCAHRNSMSDWVVGSLRSGTPITVFEDVMFSPMNMQTLCCAIALALDSKIAGTFNIGANSGSSKAHVARALAKLLDLDPTLLVSGRSSDMKLRALRPTDMIMDSRRFAQEFGFSIPSLLSQIEATADEYRHD